MDTIVSSSQSSPPNVYGPITAGEMYERTFALLRGNLKLFFGIVLVAIGVEIVVGAVLGFGGMWTRHATGGANSLMKAMFMAPLALLGTGLIYVFSQIIQGALFFATQAKLSATPINVGEACRLAADKTAKIVGISLSIALRMMGYLLLIYFAVAALAAVMTLMLGGFAHVAGQLQFRSGAAPSIGMYVVLAMFVIVFLMIYLVCILWLVARYAAAIPASLAENLGVTDAIRRSIHLTAKNKGRIYALFVVVVCVWFVITAVTFPIQFLAATVAMKTHSITPAMVGVISLLVVGFRMITSAILIAFTGVATTLCYYDLRVRKEGFGGVPPLPSVAIPPTSWPGISQLPDPDVQV